MAIMKKEIIWLSILALGLLASFAAVQGMLFLARLPEFWAWFTGICVFLNIFAVRAVFHYRERSRELSALLGSNIRLRDYQQRAKLESLIPPEPAPEPEPHKTQFLPDEFPTGDAEISEKEFNERQAIGYKRPSPTPRIPGYLYQNGRYYPQNGWWKRQ